MALDGVSDAQEEAKAGGIDELDTGEVKHNQALLAVERQLDLTVELLNGPEVDLPLQNEGEDGALLVDDAVEEGTVTFVVSAHYGRTDHLPAPTVPRRSMNPVTSWSNSWRNRRRGALGETRRAPKRGIG